MNPPKKKSIKDCIISTPGGVLGNSLYFSHMCGHRNACHPLSRSVICEPSYCLYVSKFVSILVTILLILIVIDTIYCLLKIYYRRVT